MLYSSDGLIALSEAPGIGPVRLRSLILAWPDPDSLRRAAVGGLPVRAGMTRRVAAGLRSYFLSGGFDDARRRAAGLLAQANRLGARFITAWDDLYPPLLLEIPDPPPFLFVLGSVPAARLEGRGAGSMNAGISAPPAIAIVGTRNPTPYGSKMAERFSSELAAGGSLIVSGLARGIDTAAHRAALEVGGGTIAVIANGPDICYPPENRKLAELICRDGAILTELPPGTLPDPSQFPRRNRIISGMTGGTVVIESAIRGGAMITARMALEQNREVFAVPGRAGAEKSSGCHALIRSGRAKLAETAADILEEFGIAPAEGETRTKRADSAGPRVDVNEIEDRILRLLDTEEAVEGEPVHVDRLGIAAGMAPAEILGHLLLLEVKGEVRQLPGKRFIRDCF